MFIAHLPAGYILTKNLQKNFDTSRYLLLGLIASVLPDIDIFYFYLIDNRQNLHHSYWIHVPFYWLITAIIAFIAIYLTKNKKYKIAAIIFFANIFLHLILDTFVGGIEWLAPFFEKSFYLIEVPAVYNFWVYNFILHWSFLLEGALIIWALFILNKKYIKLNSI